MSQIEDQEFNTPDAYEVYEGEPELAAVKVQVVGTVRTDEMPTDATWRHVLLPTGGRAQKVLNGDPRRKMFIMWAITLGAGCEAVMFGSKEDVEQNSGALLLVGTGALRYESGDKRELYAKGVVINETTGTFTSFGASTDDCFINFSVEQWSD